MQLSKGARILLKTVASSDSLLGAELLLKAEGRAALTAQYAALFQAGDVEAVATGTKWGVPFLESQAVPFFEDYGRDNDISYYEVNEPDQTLKKTQPSGYRHCVPRSLVSEGEKKLFAETLLALDLECLLAARGGAATAAGVSLDVDGDAEAYLKVGAASAPDFFVARVADAADAALAVAALEANRSRMALGSHVDLKGIRHDDAEESPVGFDIPVVLVPGAAADLAAVVAAARSPAVAGVVAPAPLGADEAAALGATCAVLSPEGAGAAVVFAP